MGRPRLSIIIPVYNAEGYLSRCLDSLLSSADYLDPSYGDGAFEIIIIDDGSTDSSLAICNEYAQRDYRIRVYHQENKGVAAARERGIRWASGEYSIHVDPDDWVEPDALAYLVRLAGRGYADMIIFDFMVDYADRSVYASQNIDKMEAKHCLSQLMYGKIHGSLCNKLIRTDLYRQYCIHFIEGLNHCEDYLICVQLFLKDISIEYIPRAFYHYDQVCNDHSITRKYTKHTLSMRLRFLEELKKLVKGHPALPHVAMGVAVECYHHHILSSYEYAQTFRPYRWDFLRSQYKLKHRIVYAWKTMFACLKSRKGK